LPPIAVLVTLCFREWKALNSVSLCVLEYCGP
jgi:hypothetical protein